MHTGKVLLLDGAMGTELRARGVSVADYKSSIWSALALVEAPASVQKLHEDYIGAGADVITANNYAVTRKLLARENAENRLEELTISAVNLASAARKIAGRPDVKIAGSLAPLDTSYRWDLVGPYEDNLATYRGTAGLLAPHVDIMLCETMSTADEARAAATAAAETGKPAWVSWTLNHDGSALRSGESVADALKALAGLPVEAFMFNCICCGAAHAALPGLVAASGKPVGIYANPVHAEAPVGEPAQVIEKPLDAKGYAHEVQGWLDGGAWLVGGCCDTSPAHIARLRTVIDRHAARSAG